MDIPCMFKRGENYHLYYFTYNINENDFGVDVN